MKAEIERFIRSGGDFGTTALALYRWQRAHNPAYDRFCADAEVVTWRDIPAVPTTLFRDIPFACFEAAQARTVFRTSGTTVGRRGVIYLLDTDIYELGSRQHAESFLGSLPTRGVSLVSHSVDSSLGHMCQSFIPTMQTFFSQDAGVNAPGAWQALSALAAGDGAVFVPGTAFALAELLEHAHAPVTLPPGSIVMITGGFKGRQVRVSSGSLLAALAQRLPGVRLVGEYGMSELSSQLWSEPAGTAFHPPPWMRVQPVDPGTGRPTDRGQLRFFDLANHQTVLAIETQDEGTVHPDGSVTLHGRLAGQDPRGCSLTVEEARDR